MCFNSDPHKHLNENDFFRLWNSEANRTFADRIPEVQDCIQFNMGLHDAGALHFQHHRQESQHLLKPEHLGRPLFSHINALPSEFTSTFRDCPQLESIKHILEKQVAMYNDTNKATQINVSMFNLAMEQVVKINRIILQPYTSVIQIGVEGQGKMALSRLALFISHIHPLELDIATEVDRDDWLGILKETVSSVVTHKKQTCLIIQDNQINDHRMLEDLNCLLKNGNLPDLLIPSEQYNLDRMIVSQLSSSQLQCGLPESNILFNECIERLRYNFKAIVNLTPNGKILKQELKHCNSLVACSTIICMDRWPEEAYREVGLIRLQLREEYSDDDEADFEAMIGN